MIVRGKPDLADVLLAVRGTLLPRIAGRLVLIALVTAMAVLARSALPDLLRSIGAIPFTLIGLALSIFMSFRNNACYDRWWEGRKQWGALVVAGRALARQSGLLCEPARHALLVGVAAFAGALAARLRGRDESAAIAAAMALGGLPAGDPAPAPNPTDALLQAMGLAIQREWHAGRLDALGWRMIEEQICAMGQVQAACERIATTPVPFAYSLLLHRTAHVFCLGLPVALAGAMGWWALLPCLLVGYTFFGLDALGDQLEDPFGLEPNDLPLDALVRTIEREMLAALGQGALPQPLVPVDGVLL